MMPVLLRQEIAHEKYVFSPSNYSAADSADDSDYLKFITNNSYNAETCVIRGNYIIRIYLTQEENGYSAVNQDLNIFSGGNTPQEAVEDFCADLDYFINHYNSIADNKLTEKALELKKIYKKLRQ